MTIDEAIGHAEERACGNDQCAKDHAQLADWLRELRRARMEIDLLKTLRDGFKADAQKYKAENARLRELCKSMRCALADFDDEVYLVALDETLVNEGFDLQKLGIEVK